MAKNKTEIGFLPKLSFINFVESFPGLTLGHIENPQFILPPNYFCNVTARLPQNSDGSAAIPKALLAMIENYLFFQSTYFGRYHFIDKDNIVYELCPTSLSFLSTGIIFDEWVEPMIENWYKK